MSPLSSLQVRLSPLQQAEEEVARLQSENARLKEDQIPRRCIDCARLMGTTSMWCHNWRQCVPADGYCWESEPKEAPDER